MKLLYLPADNIRMQSMNEYQLMRQSDESCYCVDHRKLILPLATEDFSDEIFAHIKRADILQAFFDPEDRHNTKMLRGYRYGGFSSGPITSQQPSDLQNGASPKDLSGGFGEI